MSRCGPAVVNDGVTHVIIRHWRFFIQTRGRGLKMHDSCVHGDSLSRRGNPLLLCAFDIRGNEELMRLECAFHFNHVIAKWKRARFYILHGLVQRFLRLHIGERTEHRKSQRNPDSHTVFVQAQNTADGQVAKGESEVCVHLEICLELGANYSKLLLLAPPKHST